jgi:hypothetical protein
MQTTDVKKSEKQIKNKIKFYFLAFCEPSGIKNGK